MKTQWKSRLMIAGALSIAVVPKVASASFMAGTVDVDFNGPDDSLTRAATGAAVVGSAGDHWNVLGGTINSGVTLNNVTGTDSGAELDYSAPSDNSGGTANPDDALLGDFISTTHLNSSGEATAIISQLDPATTYQLYIYTSGINAAVGRITHWDVYGSATQTGRTVGPGSVSSFQSGGNYLPFTVTPALDGTIEIGWYGDSGSGGLGDFAGFQIVAPEPATLGILAFTAIPMLARRRRRQPQSPE